MKECLIDSVPIMQKRYKDLHPYEPSPDPQHSQLVPDEKIGCVWWSIPHLQSLSHRWDTTRSSRTDVSPLGDEYCSVGP